MSVHVGEIIVRPGESVIQKATADIDFMRDKILITLYWYELNGRKPEASTTPTTIEVPASMPLLSRAASEYISRADTALTAMRGGRK